MDRKIKDPWRSWQENQRSLKILARKWRILEDLNKNFEDPHEDPQEDPQRSSWRSCRILKDPWKISTREVRVKIEIGVARFRLGLSHMIQRKLHCWSSKKSQLLRCYAAALQNQFSSCTKARTWLQQSAFLNRSWETQSKAAAVLCFPFPRLDFHPIVLFCAPDNLIESLYRQLVS